MSVLSVPHLRAIDAGTENIIYKKCTFNSYTSVERAVDKNGLIGYDLNSNELFS